MAKIDITTPETTGPDEDDALPDVAPVTDDGTDREPKRKGGYQGIDVAREAARLRRLADLAEGRLRGKSASKNKAVSKAERKKRKQARKRS